MWPCMCVCAGVIYGTGCCYLPSLFSLPLSPSLALSFCLTFFSFCSLVETTMVGHMAAAAITTTITTSRTEVVLAQSISQAIRIFARKRRKYRNQIFNRQQVRTFMVFLTRVRCTMALRLCAKRMNGAHIDWLHQTNVLLCCTAARMWWMGHTYLVHSHCFFCFDIFSRHLFRPRSRPGDEIFRVMMRHLPHNTKIKFVWRMNWKFHRPVLNGLIRIRH